MGLFKAVKRAFLGKNVDEGKSASKDADKLINALSKSRSALNIRMKKAKVGHFFHVNHTEYRECFDALFDFITKNPIQHAELLRVRKNLLDSIFSVDIGDMGLDATILDRRLSIIRANAPPSYICHNISGNYLSKCLPNKLQCKCTSDESVCFRRQAKSRNTQQQPNRMTINTDSTPRPLSFPDVVNMVIPTSTKNSGMVVTTPGSKLPPPITPAVRMRMRSMSQTCFNFENITKPPHNITNTTNTNDENTSPTSPLKRTLTTQRGLFSPKSPKLTTKSYATEKTAQMAPGTELHKSMGLIAKSMQDVGFTSPLRKRANAIDNVPMASPTKQTELSKPKPTQAPEVPSMGGFDFPTNSFDFPMGNFDFPTPATRRQSLTSTGGGLYFKVDKSVHASNPFFSPTKRAIL